MPHKLLLGAIQTAAHLSAEIYVVEQLKTLLERLVKPLIHF